MKLSPKKIVHSKRMARCVQVLLGGEQQPHFFYKVFGFTHIQTVSLWILAIYNHFS